MARRRSLTSILFKTARTVDDIETLASGNPRRIELRVWNKAIGRVLGPRWVLALALEVSADPVKSGHEQAFGV